MKHQSQKHNRVFYVLFCLLFVLHGSYAQESKKSKDSAKAVATKMLVDSQQYVFNVESVMPMKGGVRTLTPGYTVKVSQDSIICDLPYFGRAYQATPGSSEGGIKFTSTQFEYMVKDRKKGGWDITIKPKDAGPVQELNLTVYDNASTNLDITSNDRQPISFRGHIDAIQKRKN